jgi:hypothetical protein
MAKLTRRAISLVPHPALRNAVTSTAPVNPTLHDIFDRHRTRRWFFVAPGGNWGDQLIYRGAEALARRVGLEWAAIDIGEMRGTALGPEDCIYLHGGGGFNSWCSGRVFDTLAEALSNRVALVVQGPQTAEDSPSFLEHRLGPILRAREARELVFFAREKVTEANLRRVLGASAGVTISLDHDTAFHLSLDEIPGLAGRAESTLARGGYRLNVCREDPESAGSSFGSLTEVVLDAAYFARTFEQWIAVHIEARSVTSDRLHSAIVSSLLGRQVTLVPGSYHKNRSVFEHSLRDRGVIWKEPEPRAPEPALLRRLRNSYKFRKFKCVLAGVPRA